VKGESMKVKEEVKGKSIKGKAAVSPAMSFQL
jgi:hypothetical protein